jgi:hypothetical protein
MPNITQALRLVDAWQNIRSGFGGTTTPASLTQWFNRNRLSPVTLDGMYTQNWLVAEVVNAIPEDAVRRWLQVTGVDDAEIPDALIKDFKRLNVRAVFKRAHILSRLFGGAAIIVGAFDGQEVDQPLNLRRVREVLFLNVVSRWRCQPIRWYLDPADVRYGEVSHYLVTDLKQTTTRTAVVHESRVIRWEGEEVTDEERLRQNGWGGAVMERTYEVIRDYGITMESIGNIVQDFVTTTLQVEGLQSLIANDDWATIEARLQLAAQQRSGHNMTLIGEGEMMTKTGTPLTGIGEIIENATRDLCGACGIPESRLFSAYGGALNSSGGADADLRNYYDSVKVCQEVEYTPKLERLAEIICAPHGVDSAQIHFEWLPLWEPTITERATEYKTYADADAVYISNGVLSPDEVRATRFGGARFNTGSIALDADDDPTEETETPEPDEQPDAE